jgi:putative ABC transport system permease protein
MLGIMLEKLWHKKWMNVCLLLGCILLTATVVSFPIYRSAAYNRMLTDEFESYIVSEGKWPAIVTGNTSSMKEAGGKTLARMEEFPDGFYDYMKVDKIDTFFIMNLASTNMSSDTKRGEAQQLAVKLGSIDNMLDHADIIYGEAFSETGITDDGYIEVLVSQSALISKGVLVGEKFTFDDLRLPDKTPIKIVVKGVFDAKPDSGYFWQIKPEKMGDYILCNPAVFREKFTGDNAGKYNIKLTFNCIFDYSKIEAKDVKRIVDVTDYYLKESAYKKVLEEPEYMKVIDDYNIKVSRISATLIILQVPVLAMLAAFLLMISGQMYEMEKNEISVIKSRGSSSFQIIRLYFYQGTLITLVGAAVGLPLGAFFAKILGSTRNFLEFNFSRSLSVAYTKETFVYALCAMGVCLLSITIPSIKHSRVTIVNLKQSKALKRKSLWEKLFVDILLLGASLYGFYSFNKNMKDLSNAVMAGESLDPLLYFSSSLFIVGAGLFFLRLQPHIVKLIYTLGKNKWGPASHVSFMENIKNGRKQQLIMLFLIMTVSLGMYHATVARTILDNAIENTEYLSGSDIILKETWTEIVDRNGIYTGDYIVPDYSKYNTLESAESYTRVISDPDSTVNGSANEKISVHLMGIHTKEFGSITWVDQSYNGKHYYEYLNELAAVEDGFLLSSNFNTKMGYNVGDTISVTNSKKKVVSGTVVGFIDYFPCYAPVENGLNPDGTAYSKENYLAVAHFDYVNKKCGVFPYEVWMKLKPDASPNTLVKWLNDNNVSLKKYVNAGDRMNATLEDPLLQGTNGVLTMGFVVTIILCAVGYLIYWVMSIRERELIFGVLRATGFHKGEIFHMLINEQVFSGVFSILAGIGIGKLTSKMFVPILQQAYASKDQALPMKLITVASDMYRLYGVIALVMIISMCVLVGILFKMNVTKALKLGEE